MMKATIYSRKLFFFTVYRGMAYVYHSFIENHSVKYTSDHMTVSILLSMLGRLGIEIILRALLKTDSDKSYRGW